MNTFWNGYLLVLAELLVIAIGGAMLGPLLGGTFGYGWGYVSTFAGPIALVMLAGALPALAHQRGWI